MRTYTQLTQEQRYQIKALKDNGITQAKIAKTIGVHPSTVSRELKRNKGKRGYREKQAHQFALARRVKAKPKIKLETWQMVEGKIRQEWSPEQISGWLKREGLPTVSHERIYQYIQTDKNAGGDLYKSLRCKKKRKKRYGSRDRRGQIPNRTSIEERPKVVEERSRLGDMEIDMVIGKGHQGGLVTIVDRKSRFTFIGRVGSKQAQEVADVTITLLKPVVDQVETITADNGKEFAQHQRVADELSADYYFAHPYASWERGTNENTNGLIRQYFPKTTNFHDVTDEQVMHVVNRLNHRPRKTLGYRTPHEVFYGQSSIALMT